MAAFYDKSPAVGDGRALACRCHAALHPERSCRCCRRTHPSHGTASGRAALTNQCMILCISHHSPVNSTHPISMATQPLHGELKHFLSSRKRARICRRFSPRGCEVTAPGGKNVRSSSLFCTASPSRFRPVSAAGTEPDLGGVYKWHVFEEVTNKPGVSNSVQLRGSI